MLLHHYYSGSECADQSYHCCSSRIVLTKRLAWIPRPRSEETETSVEETSEHPRQTSYLGVVWESVVILEESSKVSYQGDGESASYLQNCEIRPQHSVEMVMTPCATALRGSVKIHCSRVDFRSRREARLKNLAKNRSSSGKKTLEVGGGLGMGSVALSQ
jgi:hypothetical protein